MSATKSFEERGDRLRQEVRQGQAGGARFHPDLEELAAYFEGGLPESRRDEIREHLVGCASCAVFLLDLAEVSAAAAEPASAVPAAESTARWEKLHSRLVDEGLALPQAAQTVVAHTAAYSSTSWHGWVGGLAAALLVSVLINGWFWQAAHQPRLVVASLTLAVTRGGGEVLTLTERSSRKDVVFYIIPNGEHKAVEPHVEIKSVSGRKSIWSGPAGMAATGDLAVTVPTSYFAPGDYRVFLWDGTGGDRQSMGQYAFQIEHPEPD